MLLVILGAGASHDSLAGAAKDERPPLASDLLADRFNGSFNKFIGSGAAANRVLAGMASGNSLEAELQALRDRADAGYDPLKSQLVALQFFLQDIMAGISATWGERKGGMNNFASLVGALEEWRVRYESAELLYVTFNYDTLLEQALERELPGVNYRNMERYLDDERAVIKVHGSWNWKRKLEAPALPSNVGNTDVPWLIANAPGFRLSDDYLVEIRTSRITVDSLIALAPAVAIPVVNKAGAEFFSCPPAHLARMRTSMSDVTDVLVVGWKGNEAHFLSELHKHVPHAAKVTIVGQPVGDVSDPKAVVTCHSLKIDWPAKAGLRGGCRVYRTGFSGFVEHHLDTWLGTVTP